MGERVGERKRGQEKLLLPKGASGRQVQMMRKSRGNGLPALALEVSSEGQSWGPGCCSFGS